MHPLQWMAPLVVLVMAGAGAWVVWVIATAI
jgi:hypothetical protein